MPLQSQFIITRKSEISGTRSPHLVMKKSPSPPHHFIGSGSKGGSPVSPEEVENNGRRVRGGHRDFGSICVTTNPTAAIAVQAELHGCGPKGSAGNNGRPRSSSHCYGTSTAAGHLVQQGNKKSPKTSPQISPSSSSSLMDQHELVNEKNGNSGSTDESPASVVSVVSSSQLKSGNSMGEQQGDKCGNNSSPEPATAICSTNKELGTSGGGQNALGILQFRIR